MPHADRSYTMHLLAGIAEHIAAATPLTDDDGAFATYRDPDGAVQYADGDPRPIYLHTLTPQSADECIRLQATTPVDGPNGNIMTPVHVLYRGPRRASTTSAVDIAEYLSAMFRLPNGYPFRGQLGRVMIGRVMRESFGNLRPDGDMRPQASQTLKFYGRRNALVP